MADPVSAPVTTEFQNKLNTVLRYGGTSAASIFTVMGVFSILTPEQIVELKASIETFNASVVSAYGALTKMWVILGPALILLLTKLGMNSSTVQALAAKLLGIAKNDADPKATEAQVAIVAAAASPVIAGTSGGVVAKPELAQNPATPSNVVSTPAELPKAA